MGVLQDLNNKRYALRKQSVLGSNIVKEAKLLLENNAYEEQELLRLLRMDTHIQIVQDEIGNKIELKQAEDSWGSVYLYDEIREICLDYRLRFLPCKYFKGNISRDLPSAILRFCKKHDIPHTDSYLHERFFVMAPRGSFALEDKPKDPLLFYRIDDKDRYVLVHQWGNDLSPMRLVKGFFFRNKLTHSISIIFLTSCLFFILSALFGPNMKHESFITLVSVLHVVTTVLVIISRNVEFTDKLSVECWDSKFI